MCIRDRYHVDPELILPYLDQAVKEAINNLSWGEAAGSTTPVSYTHLRAHETPEHIVCRLLLEKKKKSTPLVERSYLSTLTPPSSNTSLTHNFSNHAFPAHPPPH